MKWVCVELRCARTSSQKNCQAGGPSRSKELLGRPSRQAGNSLRMAGNACSHFEFQFNLIANALLCYIQEKRQYKAKILLTNKLIKANPSAQLVKLSLSLREYKTNKRKSKCKTTRKEFLCMSQFDSILGLVYISAHHYSTQSTIGRQRVILRKNYQSNMQVGLGQVSKVGMSYLFLRPTESIYSDK